MDKSILNKICNFSYVTGIVAICTLGICPAFAIMAITVGVVLNIKNVSLDKSMQRKLKIARILGIISLVLFVVDIILAYIFLV